MLVLLGCGSAPPLNPQTLLQDAKSGLDSATSLHFQLSSSNVPTTTGAIVGGSGDVHRPASFRGNLNIDLSGVLARIGVVSIAGNFWVQTPLTRAYVSANPEDYGFGDPAQLLSPQTGLSSLLQVCGRPQSRGRDRYQGEELDEVGCRLPGTAVASLLTSADPKRYVDATFGMDVSHHQLRRVSLRGPFYRADTTTTFTLILNEYNEAVVITPPPS